MQSHLNLYNLVGGISHVVDEETSSKSLSDVGQIALN